MHCTDSSGTPGSDIFLIIFWRSMGSSHLISCLKTAAFISNPEVSSEFNSMQMSTLLCFMAIIDSGQMQKCRLSKRYFSMWLDDFVIGELKREPSNSLATAWAIITHFTQVHIIYIYIYICFLNSPNIYLEHYELFLYNFKNHFLIKLYVCLIFLFQPAAKTTFYFILIQFNTIYV